MGLAPYACFAMDKMEEGDGAKGVGCGGLQEMNQKEISYTYI
jgi:hypothetical protein